MFKFLGLCLMSASEYDRLTSLISAYAGLEAAHQSRDVTADKLIAAQKELIDTQESLLNDYRAILFPNKKEGKSDENETPNS